MKNLEDKIAMLCLNKYNLLKKTGKPNEREWTVLSGVVLENSFQDLSVISLCTGTKCLSGIELKNTKYSECGDRLSDSHAEILARRALLRYFYYQIELIQNNKNSDIFSIDNDIIKLKNVSFHFFSSQSPCGDCSIIPKLNSDTFVNPNKKRKIDNNDFTEIELGLEVEDIHRTGAKCIESDKRQDPLEKGVQYHTVGPLRTKPGRGDRTLSLSCSDKIAKWNVMGVQGALLSLIIPSIRFKSIIIGNECPYSFESMQRGLCKRFDTNIEAPIIKQSKLSFEHKKGGLRIKPCPSSIIWCAIPEKSTEIAVDGFKQGTTKKSKNRRLTISRKELFKTFLKVYEKFPDKKKFTQHPKKLMYYHCKQYSVDYQKLWENKRKIFPNWPIKPLNLLECLSF